MMRSFLKSRSLVRESPTSLARKPCRLGDQKDRLVALVLAQSVEEPPRFVLAEELDRLGFRPAHRPRFCMLEKTLLSSERRFTGPAAA